MANTYAITGATGNIGHKITEKLLAEGHNVRAIARTAEKLQSIFRNQKPMEKVDIGAENALSKHALHQRPVSRGARLG